MLCVVSQTSYERCGCSMGCEVAMASEHDVDITTGAGEGLDDALPPPGT